jgi:hypothetical protein
MAWYAGHAILFVEWKDGHQPKYPVWENIYLIQADSAEEALRLTRVRGEEDAGDSGGEFTWEGRPARWVMAGVRKVVECDEMDSGGIGHGIELSYSEFEVKDRESVENLAKLVRVAVDYVD